LFANDVERFFVGAQPKDGWMPHLAVTRPFAEFQLANELRNKPSGNILVFNSLIEGLFCSPSSKRAFFQQRIKNAALAGAPLTLRDLESLADKKHRDNPFLRTRKIKR
jgi:hypothetical protein